MYNYLIPSDYIRIINDPTLMQVISGNNYLTKLAEKTAIEEICSYLIQKYDTSREFTDCIPFNPGASYKANNRIFLNGPSYDPTLTYPINALCLQNGIYMPNGIVAYPNGLSTTLYRQDLWLTCNTTPGFNSGQNEYVDSSLIGWVYNVIRIGTGPLQVGVDIQFLSYGGWQFINGYIIQPGDRYDIQFTPLVQSSQSNILPATGLIYMSNTAITIPETFNPAHWTLLGFQYEMFYVTLPYPEFDISTYYPLNTKVWYKDTIYTCLVESVILDHETAIQFQSVNSLPYPNVFPDDPVQGLINWSNNGLYTVLGSNLLNPVIWTRGDNRSQQMVELMMDMVIYKLYKKMGTKSIPEDRIDAFSMAIGKLKEWAKGDFTTPFKLIALQPPQGGRVRYGGQVKSINNY